jgi:alkylation response protein AidB-like acyl-CoA dehydrogenase
MLYRAARRVAAGEADPLFDPVLSAAKHFIVERVRSVLEETLQVLGGYFYYGDPYFGTCLRDFAGLVAVAGTQDLLEVNLGTLACMHLRGTAAQCDKPRKDVPTP